MKEKYIIDKKWGETPLEALTRLREEENIPTDVSMTYAGRLDPAAEGKLIILTGEECKNKDRYNGFSKTYEVGIVFGVSTDSYDLLGIPKCTTPAPLLGKGGENAMLGASFPSFTKEGTEGWCIKEIEKYLKSQVGKQMQVYPPYSSKTVDGVQLHEHARNGNEVELPTHTVALYEFSGFELEELSRKNVVARAVELTHIVTGDFRQAEIAEAWKTIESKLPEKILTTSITLMVSSGFYIRQLVEDLGKRLGGGACVYSLVRTEIEEDLVE